MLRAELVKKLELVGRALAPTNMVPIFQSFVFDGKTVAAYDDSIGIIAPCETEAAFAVHGKTLLGLLSASRAPEVSFTIAEGELVVKAGKSTFRLPYQTKEEFLFQPPDEAWDVTVDFSAEAIAGLEACLMTVGRDAATQPALVGVWLKQAERFYSCNGDALSRFEAFPARKGSKVLVDFMMPNAFCETLVKIVDETADVAAEVAASVNRVKFNKGWAKASIGGWYTIYGRLIENENPLDHEDLITKTLKGEVSYAPIPEGLDHALSRARVVADPESKPTQLTVKDGKLHLLTDTHLGVIRDVLPFKHPDVVALVSAELLQRAISLTSEMAIMDNCCCFSGGSGHIKPPTLWQLLSNYG